MDTLLKIVQTVNTYLTDYILIFLLIGTGLFFTIKTKFVQVRCFGEGMRKVFGNFKLRGGKNEGGLSSFQALATAIAAQVGTGNIVGASGAILIGGPGAIFWMWIIAFFGMATIYAEATLAQETRVVKEDGSVLGGPVYYIKRAFTGGFGKFLAVFFAIAAVLALGFMGSMVQSNSIAGAIEAVVDPAKQNVLFSIGSYNVTLTAVIVGAIVALVAAFIFLGGVQRIAAVTEKIVPIMAALFLAGGVVLLAFNYKHLPSTIGMIFKYAFTPQALIGGGIGAALKIAISQGAKRGLFSNEAGMGSTPHAHAQANVKRPHDQGVVAMVGVFIDTFVVLTMTALIIITCVYNGEGKLATYSDENSNKPIVVDVDYYKDNGELEKTKKNVETNLYLVATGQADNNTIAELVINGNIAVNDVIVGKNDKDLVSLVSDNTIKLENKTVEELFEKYPDAMVASDSVYKNIISGNDNVISIDDAVAVMTGNKAITDIAVISKNNAMQTAFKGSFFGNFGSIFVAVCLLFFAFSTIISWNFFGKINMQYLCGKKEKAGVVIYSIIAVGFVFLGSILQNDLVWELTDFFNYLMVLPNVIALIALAKMVGVVKRTKKEKKQ